MKKTCQVEGCSKPVNARGWCSMHYERWRLHGDVAWQPRVDPPRLCSVGGCAKKHEAQGYCPAHLRRFKLYGDPLALNADPQNGTPWTDDEYAFLRATTELTASQVAKHLGRTVGSVRGARGALRRDEGISFAKSNTVDPHHVGGRRLLAKTCLGCGLLLEASWFAPDRSKGARYWRPRCTRCKSQSENKDTRRERDSRRVWVASNSTRRLESLAADRAARKGQPWLDRDHVVLRDSTLTVFEKAIQLQRTYQATKTAVSANGYTSRVGKGDPMRGAWHIDNPNETKAVAAA